MKIQYLGFLPVIIIETVCHYFVIAEYLSYLKTHNFLDLNPIPFALVIIFWISASVIGAFWAIM